MGREDLSITHVFFANDSILFRDTTIEWVNRVKTIVTEYKALSSPLVNFDKTLIYFSKSVNKDLQQQLEGILRVQIANNPKKYLGLSTIIGRRKKKELFFLN